MPYANVDGLNLYYEVYGKGEPMILINGLKTDHTRWFMLRDLLIETHQVIVFDNRATGRTTDDGNPFSVRNMADDTMKLMEYLGFGSADVVGHSLGGAIAQTIAYHYPEKIKKLYLLNTFIKLNEAAKAGFHEILKLHQEGRSPGVIAEAMLPWGYSQSFITPERRKTILELSQLNPYPQSAADFQRQYQALIDFDSIEWVDKIRAPTYVVASKEDITATPSESEVLVNKIHKSQLFLLPGGHASVVERPSMIAEILKSMA